MSNLIAVIIAPIIVGVIMLMIEYWIIQPIRKSRDSQQPVKKAKTSTTKPSNKISRWTSIILFVTGIASFIGAIVTILGRMGNIQTIFSSAEVLTFGNNISSTINFFDVNITLAVSI